MRRAFALVMALGLVLVGGLKAEAQWIAGDYEFDQVEVAGEYTLILNSSYAHLDAHTPTGFGVNAPRVRFSRTYICPAGTPNLSVTPKALLEGTAGTGGVRAASSAIFSGISEGTSSNSSGYSATYTWFALGGFVPQIATITFSLSAEAGRSPMGFSTASSRGWLE